MKSRPGRLTLTYKLKEKILIKLNLKDYMTDYWSVSCLKYFPICFPILTNNSSFRYNISSGVVPCHCCNLCLVFALSCLSPNVVKFGTLSPDSAFNTSISLFSCLISAYLFLINYYHNENNKKF